MPNPLAFLTARDIERIEDDIASGLVQVGSISQAVKFEGLGDLLAQEIERALKHSAASALHGARISGAAAGEDATARGTWVAVGGEKGDGKNCSDCLELHGQQMTREQYLDTKYTTACDGNCRCEFVPDDAVDDAKQIESIATSELEDAQE